jgi:outer membrane protein OmpU
MNKQLLASTALVAAGVLMTASQASAAGKTVKLGLHGYMTQMIGVAFDRSDNEATTARANSKTSFDQQSESEIHFKGSGKLDNGITIIADVQLEVTGSPGNIIDEQYMIVRGGFGQLILGSEDNAGHLMTIGYSGSWATGVGQNLTFHPTNFVSLASGINAAARHDGTLNNVTLRSLDNDSSKISYFTPRFSGFQVGASYIPNFQQQTSTGSGGSIAGKSGLYHEGWAIGANYTGKFNKVGIGVAVGYLTAESSGGESADVENTTGQTWQNDDDMTSISGAIRIDVGPFRVAAAVKRNEDVVNGAGGVGNGVQSSRSLDGVLFDVGARYKMGAHMMSIGYRNGRMEGEMGGGNEEEQAFMGSYARALGAGVKWHTNLMYLDTEDDINRNSTTVKGTLDGWALSTGISLSF